ncbi:MAG: threonine--tRNA ligase [Spirochaetales bacterium]|jgi:threonyl-tRNA synthetase|nr:threonine--tRNA ligase [Spirochaetales bacterium]
MEQKERLEVARHSTSHIMAEAVLRMFPDAKIAIGPAIENGFYYDFDLPRNLTNEDLGVIEENMRSIMREGVSFTRETVSREEARGRFASQPYKLELLDAIPQGEEVSIYTSGHFTDLCRGPHVESAKELNPEAFKLLSIAGAYWRGDEKNRMLQRVYGTAWLSRQDLRDYLTRLEEIEKRDHRRLGRELDLFSTHEEAGPGLIYWHPKGGRVRQTIEDYWREQHRKNGYELLYTPHIGRSWLWQTSGHLGHYRENMYAPMEIDDQDYYLKPMNCPFHILIYQAAIRSYRDLPLRWAELGTVYRYERSGVLHGLLRVRGFTQDDAHIFCSPDQIESEILEVLRFSLRIWKDFGFQDIRAYLATKPKSSVGEEADWNIATESLKKAIQTEGLSFEIDEGGGAFYGPKIDLKIKDALGREWQMTTIQFDFNEPARFDMSFVDSDGKQKRPFMVHRALLGSLERFFGVLIEHYGGAFPVWLAPVQAVVIPVAPPFNDYASSVSRLLCSAGLRAQADLSDTRMNAKIRGSQAQKVPYMLVVGASEQQSATVSIRTREGGQMNNMPTDEFVKFITAKVAAKETL